MPTIVYFHIPAPITIVFLVTMPSSTILAIPNDYFDNPTIAYGQTDQTIFNNLNPLNIQNIPVKKSTCRRY